MKVTNNGSQNLEQIYRSQTERASQSDGEKAASPQPPGRQDSVELSKHAQLMQKAAVEVEREDPERAERVEDLRRQVQDGSYQVPLKELSTRMMTELF